MYRKQAKSFGVRGMSAAERAAANPYLGRRVPLGGSTFVGEGDAVAGIDGGLRAFMHEVYAIMFIGLSITGLMAWLTYNLTVTADPAAAATTADGLIYGITETAYLTPLGVMLWATPVSYAVCFGPLALLLFCGGAFRGLDTGAASGIFAVVAGLIGISFSGLAVTYTGASITSVFFTTAAAFAGLSLVGYTTKKDLSGWGSFLWMGFFGLLVAIIVNMVLKSDALQFAVCGVGVLVFAGFIAYDTQMIKEAYSGRMSGQERRMLALNGALDLYLDFVNLFRFLLFFLGSSEE